MKTLLLWILAAIIMVVLVVHETGMLEEHFGPGAPAGTRLLAAPAPAGEVVPLKRAEVAVVRWSSGRVVAPHVVQVFPELGGRVLSLSAPIGAALKAGDRFASLDPEAANLAVAQANANLALAESRVGAASAAAAAAETLIQAAEVGLDHARLEAERQTKLMEKEATTDQAYQAAKSALLAAEARVASAQAGRAQAEAEVQSARESVRLADVGRKDAERVAKKTDVLAPMDGIVVARHVEAGSMASPSAALISMRAANELDAVAYFPEERVPAVGELLYVRLLGRDFGKLPVTELGAELESFTRTRAVHVALSPARAVRRQGQVQSVRLQTERGFVEQHVRTVALFPAEAAELGLRLEDWLEVRSGLRAEDRVEVRD